jgi:hypothetical protein
VTNYIRSRKKENNGIVRHGWVKPKDNYVKLNVDASFHAYKESGATGMTLRDDHGFFITGGNCTIPFVEDVEAMALRDELMMVQAIGLSKMVINLDCVEVVDVMKNGCHIQGHAAVIYKDCLFLCREFNDVIFKHCSRESNFAAHVLAREAVDDSQLWKDDHLILSLM